MSAGAPAHDLLPDDPAQLKALLLAERAMRTELVEEVARLEAIVAAFRRAAFGRRSERLDPGQLELALEEAVQELAEMRVGRDAADPARASARAAQRRTRRGGLPAHLPRVEVVIAPENLAYCWSHCRRKFCELAAAGDAPVAQEALRRIAVLYRIGTELRGQSPEHRRAGRQADAEPLLAALRPWLEDQLVRVPSKSRLAEALRYPLKHWDGLVRYLADGRLEIDTNIVERSIRPLALNRKNALFAGSDRGAEHWAVIASLIETCKLNGANPHAYLTETLGRLVAGHPQSRIDELMP